MGEVSYHLQKAGMIKKDRMSRMFQKDGNVKKMSENFQKAGEKSDCEGIYVPEGRKANETDPEA